MFFSTLEIHSYNGLNKKLWRLRSMELHNSMSKEMEITRTVSNVQVLFDSMPTRGIRDTTNIA